MRRILFVVALALVACSPQSVATLPSGASLVRRNASIPACKGQTTTSEYAASKPSKLKHRNTHACIPAFEGFGGSLHYPAATPAVSATLTSSTTNYNSMLPQLSKGKPIFYLQIATGAATTFAATYTAAGGLTSKAIEPGKTYDVYGQARYGGVVILLLNLPPCRATAIKSKEGGALTNLGSLLKGQSIPGAANITIEVYAKGRVTASC